MASNSPLGTRRWATDRARMRRELRAFVDQLVDELDNPLPEAFDPVVHGLLMERLLAALRDGVQAPDTLVGLSVESSPSAPRLASHAPATETRRELDTIRTERTRPLAEVSRLQRSTADMSTRAAAYESLGEPDEIRARIERLEAIASAATILFRLTDGACMSYEAVLGPLLLSAERSERTLSSLFLAIDHPGDDRWRLDHMSRPLIPALRRLAASAAEFATVDEAIDAVDRLARDEADDATATGSPLFGTRRLPRPEDLRALEAFAPAMGERASGLFYSRDDLQEKYDAFMRMAGRQSPRASNDGDDGSYLDSEEDEGEQEEDGSEYESPASRGGRRRLSIASEVQPSPRKRQARTSVVQATPVRSRSREGLVLTSESSRPPQMSRDRLQRMRRIFRSDNWDRLVAHRRTRGLVRRVQSDADGTLSDEEVLEDGEDWPISPPTGIETPTDLGRLREFVAWYFDLVPEEQLAPVPQEVRQLLTDLRDARQASVAEVLEFYRSRPWQRLAPPPPPATFELSSAHPLVRELYDNAAALYQADAHVLFERMHFVVVDPRSRVRRGGDVYTGSDFLRERRVRNANFTRHWNGHLALLRDVLALPGVDIDFLLEPFLYWPPPYGVALAVPRTQESLQECVDRLDAVNPARAFYRQAQTASVHISAPYRRLSSDRQQAIRAKFTSALASVRVGPSTSEYAAPAPDGDDDPDDSEEETKKPPKRSRVESGTASSPVNLASPPHAPSQSLRSAAPPPSSSSDAPDDNKPVSRRVSLASTVYCHSPGLRD